MRKIGFIKNNEDEMKNLSSIIVPEEFTHSIAFGETGSGKTSSYIYPNLEHRINLGHGILLYDYKGKEHLSVKFLADQAGRLDDIVEIGKPWGEKINIIQNMDEDQLDKFFDTVLDHGKDNQFWQNSAKSLGLSIVKVLRALENFSKELIIADRAFRHIHQDHIRIDRFNFPIQTTLKSLIWSCKSFEHLGEFISKLDEIESETARILSNNILNYNDDIKDRGVSKLIEKKYSKAVFSRNKLIECVEDVKDTLAGFGKDSNENLTQNIIGSLISPLVMFAQNSYFNTDEFNIIQALEEGKIIIVNTESLSDQVIESLNNTLLYELSKRTKNISKHPVSVFIDEVQRMLSKKTDLPVDIFREAKVDLFLATQNSALLKDKLEEEKYESLMGNLTKKYYFKSSVDEGLEGVKSLEFLESFEYLSSIDNYMNVSKSRPIFINLQKKLEVEYGYQKKLNVLENYLYNRRNQGIVLEYDAKYFNDGKLIAIYKKTMKEKLVDYISKDDSRKLKNEIKSITKEVEESLHNRSIQDSIEKEVDDFFELSA